MLQITQQPEFRGIICENYIKYNNTKQLLALVVVKEHFLFAFICEDGCSVITLISTFTAKEIIKPVVLSEEALDLQCWIYNALRVIIYRTMSMDYNLSSENSDNATKQSMLLLQMSTEDKLSCHCVKEINIGSINIGETFAHKKTLKVKTDADMTRGH